MGFRNHTHTFAGDFHPTTESIVDTFPWPQTPTKGQIAEVAVGCRGPTHLAPRDQGQIRLFPARPLPHPQNPGANPLRDAHTRFDTTVHAAYAMPKDVDPLPFLLALDLTLAAREKAGAPITPPGVPLPDGEQTAFLTDDCICITEP